MEISTASRLMLLSALALTGCTGLDHARSKRAYRDVIFLHDFSTHKVTNTYDRKVEYAPGKIVYLRRTSVLSSLNIVAVEPYPVSDGMGLRFYLDDHGRYVWTQVSAEYNGRLLALLVDLQLRGFVRVRHTTKGSFSVDGPFTPQEAARISKNARVNYKKHKPE